MRLRQEIEGEARDELQRARESLEAEGRNSASGKLCATPFGIDVVGISQVWQHSSHGFMTAFSCNRCGQTLSLPAVQLALCLPAGRLRIVSTPVQVVFITGALVGGELDLLSLSLRMHQSP